MRPSCRRLPRHPGVGAVASWTCLLLLGAFLGHAPADEQGGLRPPASQFGLPLADGSALWHHLGMNPPPDQAGVRWCLEVVGQRSLAGRPVDVLRYVARNEAGEAVAARDYGQADFVDPSTGEVVGGLSGWGNEIYPEEPPLAAACEQR